LKLSKHQKREYPLVAWSYCMVLGAILSC